MVAGQQLGDTDVAGPGMGPSCLAFCLSLCGDAFCTGEMGRQELSGSVQRRRISLRLGWFSSAPGSLAHVNPLP
jgi:hypothetical protein